MASQLSLLSIVILLGAVFFTVNNALQQQQEGSHASSTSSIKITTPSCIDSGYAGSGVNIYWTYSGIRSVDMGTASSFRSFYNKHISGTHNTTAPSGFGLYRGTAKLTLRPETTYYIRTWNGRSHSPIVTFSIPACQTPNPSLSPQPSVTCTPPPPCLYAVPSCKIAIQPAWCPLQPTSTINPTAVPTGVLSGVPSRGPSTAPTPTFAPGSTLLHISVGLQGIGTGGDSANPNSQGNTNPLRPDRTVTVDIYDAQNQLVTTQQGIVIFNSSIGKFDGTIDLGSQFASGLYTVKIKADQYLRSQVPGIQTITAGQTVTLPVVTLVTGDINGDNAINIADYNILIGCFSDLLPAVSCIPANQVLADLDDDGHVNATDYNLFLRELTNIGGQ